MRFSLTVHRYHTNDWAKAQLGVAMKQNVRRAGPAISTFARPSKLLHRFFKMPGYTGGRFAGRQIPASNT